MLAGGLLVYDATAGGSVARLWEEETDTDREREGADCEAGTVPRGFCATDLGTGWPWWLPACHIRACCSCKYICCGPRMDPGRQSRMYAITCIQIRLSATRLQLKGIDIDETAQAEQRVLKHP